MGLFWHFLLARSWLSPVGFCPLRLALSRSGGLGTLFRETGIFCGRAGLRADYRDRRKHHPPMGYLFAGDAAAVGLPTDVLADSARVRAWSTDEHEMRAFPAFAGHRLSGVLVERGTAVLCKRGVSGAGVVAGRLSNRHR
jgi:hypothetical protein